MNIIGDIAGNYETLIKLLGQMPPGPVLSVGDMIDRGPDSKLVIEWFMKNGEALLGNHERLLIDAIYGNPPDAVLSWLGTGGMSTLDSFQVLPHRLGKFPSKVLKWLEKLPLFYEKDDLFVSHAPVHDPEKIPRDPEDAYFPRERHAFIWNRKKPKRMKQFQIFGHNSHFGLREFSDAEGVYAICIDSSASRVLTGIHWPSRKIYQQAILD